MGCLEFVTFVGAPTLLEASRVALSEATTSNKCCREVEASYGQSYPMGRNTNYVGAGRAPTAEDVRLEGRA